MGQPFGYLFRVTGKNTFTMKSLFSLLPLFTVCLLGFASCEQTATYEVPTLADEFIDFKIDGQQVTLSAVPNDAYEPSRLEFSGETNYIVLSRNSSDQETTLTIDAENVPIKQQDGKAVITREVFVPATITVLNTQMSGSLYCPHTVDGTGESISYEGLLRVESLTDDGRVKGSFKTDPNANANVVSITEGTFEVTVHQY